MALLKRAAAMVAALIVVLLAGAWRPAVAQAPAAPASVDHRRGVAGAVDDVLPALLAEVKGLRVAIEQMASGSTQAQLLVGRLQLQEGRVTSMIRRLDTVRDSLATARREYDQVRGALAMLEKGKDPGEPQEEHEGVIAGLKSQVGAAKANVDRLATEEVQLAADIASEQQRWVAINQRLDELERTLTKR